VLSQMQLRYVIFARAHSILGIVPDALPLHSSMIETF